MARSHHTILVVEDDEDIRRTLRQILETEGYGVDEAGDGREALAYLRSHAAPCLILLDLMMPGMNGWEFSRIQQADPDLASIPVVVISAHPSVRQRAASIPAVAYLEKPMEFSALLDTVAAACGEGASPGLG